MRIIVTGSRSYSHPERVHLVLKGVTQGLIDSGETVTLVHGDCPTGADKYANDWAEGVNIAAGRQAVVIEKFPADWDAHGKMAGAYRNRAMADLGADVVYAFPEGDSRGTRGMMMECRKRNLNVVDVEEMARLEKALHPLIPVRGE